MVGPTRKVGGDLRVLSRLSGGLDVAELVRVLEDWCEPFDGYYRSRRQPSQAFSILLKALRWRSQPTS